MPKKNRRWFLSTATLMSVLLSPWALCAQNRSDEPRSGQWTSAGQNLHNTRNQAEEHSINSANVKNLSPKWVFTTGGDVSATPTVDGEAVYFPDWAGNLFAVNKNTGELIWSHRISEYNGVDGSISRVSPLVDHDQIIIGDILSEILINSHVHNGANIISVDRQTGALRWITHVDNHPASIITGSPVVFDGVIYVGVSSIEEALSANPAFPCCTFRGSVVALEAKSGRMLWKTFDMPDNGGQVGGYSGGAIWGHPAIDAKRGSLYIGTGNNYTVPADVQACQNATPTAQCASPDDHFDSILALDLKTGQIKWADGQQSFDTFTGLCPTCPVPASPDFDFGGGGPNLLGNILGIGQKSGVYWAVNPDSGKIVWSTQVGPGGDDGGVEWGTATDGKRIYVAISNNHNLAYTLVPSGQQISWGSWSALDVATGKILWQTADPTPGTIDPGAVSSANGVMYAGSYSGQMYALDAITGNILWNFASGGSVIDGPSIADGVVYWGSGYGSFPPGTANNKVFAFSLAGSEHQGETSSKDGSQRLSTQK
jgi:polyvinyl alcohol dehydrogenase (cytochrome)